MIIEELFPSATETGMVNSLVKEVRVLGYTFQNLPFVNFKIFSVAVFLNLFTKAGC